MASCLDEMRCLGVHWDVSVYRSGVPHPSLCSPGDGDIDRIPIGLHVGFLACYKEIYRIELVSKM